MTVELLLIKTSEMLLKIFLEWKTYMDFVRIHVSHTVLGRAVSLQFNGKTNALVALLCLTLCDSIDCSPPGSSVHAIFQARRLEWVAVPLSRGLPNPGIKPRSSTLQVDSWPSEPAGKSKNNRMGSLSYLQWIFLTQRSNPGHPDCRQTLYLLSYREVPSAMGRQIVNH